MARGPRDSYKGVSSRTVVDRGRCSNAHALGCRSAGDWHIVNVDVYFGLWHKSNRNKRIGTKTSVSYCAGQYRDAAKFCDVRAAKFRDVRTGSGTPLPAHG